MNRGATFIHNCKRLLSGESAAIQSYKLLRKSQLANVELYPIYSKLWSGNQSATPQKRPNYSILEGRITGLRIASKKLVFIDLHADFQTKQAILNAKHMPIELISEFKSQAQIGDIYQLVGEHGKNEKGAEIFVVQAARMLAPCFRKIPLQLKDVAIKHRFPHLNMLVDENQVNRFRKRSKVRVTYQMIWKLRQELHNLGFEEVETPCLSQKAGGATAKPFETKLLTNDQNLFLRIAPELYLKRLIIGGYDKVFEIGKQFRNEGIDATHNPEFTTLELYRTYSDLDMMIKFTEGLIRKLIIECNHGNPTVGDINFGQKFGQLDVCTELEKSLGKLPDLNDEGSVPMLVKLAERHKVDLKGSYTLPKIVDKLISSIVESKLHMPTFLTGHPVCLSPLAKSKNGRARRFELFIGGREIANSYEELNDPSEQITRFKLQGSNEDYDYCEALEYGLPPCTGLGIGIDRLAMLMCNTSKIKDVITFPMI